MQSVAWQLQAQEIDFGQAPVCGACEGLFIGTIELVANDGGTQGRQVQANLVLATGL
jgi:hypothetical protein